MTQALTLTRDLPYPIDRVWRAVSTPELIAEWLMPNDFQPVEGHAFTLRSAPQPQWDGIIAARVIAVEPPTRLCYSWTTLGVDTVVTLTLEETPSGTRLTLEHAGFAEDQPRNLAGARYGWGMFLERLAGLLAAG